MTSSGRRTRRAAARVGAAGVLVFLALAVAGALAWRAVDARRAHRRAAERTVRDYAAFAAALFADGAQAALGQTMLYAFYEAERAERTGTASPVPASALASNPPEAGRCGEAYPAGRWFARLGAGETSLDVVGPLDGSLAAWLTDTLGGLMAAPGPTPKSPYGNLFPIIAGARQVIAYRIRRDSAGRPVEAHALAHCFETGDGDAFARALQRSTLVPPTLMSPDSARTWIATSVTDRTGRTVFRSPRTVDTPYRVLRPPDRTGPLAGLTFAVSIHPKLANRLVAGGIPPPGTAPVLLLLGLAGILLAATLLQMRRAFRLVRLQERFVAAVSHELRTPLQQILLFVELLRFEELHDPAERRESLRIVERETHRLIRLVERILTFTRGDMGRRETNADGMVDVAQIARDTVVAFEPLAAQEDVRIEVEAPETRVLARATSEPLRQVLLNLLDNAVKYGPRGQRIVVRITDGADVVHIAVEDEGTGIPPAERERVWRPFYRLEREAAAARAGAGIGLAITHELVEQLAGSVRIEDAPSGGARIIVELPAAAASGAAAGTAVDGAKQERVRREALRR